MFVKLLKLKKDENGNYPANDVSVYEVDNFEFKSNDIDGVPHIQVNLYSNHRALLVKEWFPKWMINIYIMNNDGKTIDSYDWHGCEPPPLEGNEEVTKNEDCQDGTS